MIALTAGEIAEACGGRTDARATVTGVTIDSRAVEHGDLFVALPGERTDGARLRGRRPARRRGRRHGRGHAGRPAAGRAHDRRPRPADRPRPAGRRGAPPLRRPRDRHHRVDREDLHQGHPGRAPATAPAHRREPGQLQHRDRRAAHAVPDRGRHRGGRLRAGDAGHGAGRLPGRDRPPRRRRDHVDRPRASGAGREHRGRRRGEGRDPGSARRRTRRPSSRTPSRCSTPIWISRVRV